MGVERLVGDKLVDQQPLVGVDTVPNQRDKVPVVHAADDLDLRPEGRNSRSPCRLSVLSFLIATSAPSSTPLYTHPKPPCPMMLPGAKPSVAAASCSYEWEPPDVGSSVTMSTECRRSAPASENVPLVWGGVGRCCCAK